MKKFDFLEDATSYTSSISDVNIDVPKNLRQLHVSIQGDMTGASAKTPLNLLGVLNPLEIKAGGTPVMQLYGDDLLALNLLVLGHEPTIMQAGATTDDVTRVLDLLVPMNYGPGGPTLHYNATYASATGIDTELLTIVEENWDASLPESPLKILRYTYTPASSGALLSALDMVPDGAIEGFLFYSTTEPSDSADTSSLSKLLIDVGGEIVFRTREWQLMKHAQTTMDDDGSAAAYLLQNYYYLDLSQDPIPAGSNVSVRINAGDTNDIEITPIIRL